MKRVTVPGGWVDYREPEDVPERLRRRVITMSGRAGTVATRLSAVSAEEAAAEVSEEDMRFLLDFNDAIAVCLVMGWSWSDIPVTVDGLLDLPAVVYDEITRYSQGQVTRLLPNFAVDPDPKAPTES